MATIDLHYVNELIQVRQAQHGGHPGAPPIQGGYRVGVSINRSCVVMLSALLQAHIEEVYKGAAKRMFPHLAAHPADFENYWKQMKMWGNPSDANTKALFLRLGVADVFQGLSWQRTNTSAIRRNLEVLNIVRNQIAHGAPHLTVNQAPYSLSLAKVVRFRNFADAFGNRFEQHVAGFIP